METPKAAARVPIRRLVAYFLRLGSLGFGGPVALCGQMERELVQERKWLTKDEMREGIAVCQSLPGPLAIQVGIFIAYLRGGFWGAWAGGWAFILPNFVIVAVLGALYVHFGGLPWVTAVFYGVSPAVIALILHSCYRLAKLGMEDWLQWAIAAASFAITVVLQAEVALLFIGAGILGILYYRSRVRGRAASLAVVLLAPLVAGPAASAAPAGGGATLGKLLVFFLKAGSLTFGSGLVIVPFLETGLVHQTGWLDERQFLVAVAMGMLSPGARGHHGDVRGLPRRRLLGCRRLDRGDLPSLLSSGPDRRAGARAAPREPQRPGLREGRVRGRHRDDPRRERAARPDRDRRLADGARRARQPRRPVPLEGQQPRADRRDSAHRVDRVSAPPADVGLREVSPPTILFVCLHGAAKSVVAAAEFERLARARGVGARAAFAGTEPGAEIAPVVVARLLQEGIDLRGLRPRRVTPEDVAQASRVVSFACDLGDLALPGVPVERWDDVPAVGEDFDRARAAITARLERLLESLT